MHLRCPHCNSPIELLPEQPLHDVCCPSCGSSFNLISGDTTQSAIRSSRKIGRFQLLDELGVGHFGSVWKARDPELDRLVAVKIPRRENLDPQETELFLREARAAAQLRHPNIVGVHEIGREAETIYIVSDYIDGCNLKEWLSGQKLTPREAAELCATIAEALHTAHESGVIHRDLKPGNILMGLGVGGRGLANAKDSQSMTASSSPTPNPQPLTPIPHITDFGLAKRETGEITITVEGKIVGTPSYMSPEQARGEAHTADRRSDIYSLGVILFELLTGERPFRGDKNMLAVQIQKEEPPSPRTLNDRVPRDLETICLKCLEKSPDRRYATARDLAEDLKRWLNGHPIQARPIGRIERTWRWADRNPILAALITLSFVLLLGLLTAVTAAYFAQVGAFHIKSAALLKEQELSHELEGRTDQLREILNRQQTLLDSLLRLESDRTGIGTQDRKVILDRFQATHQIIDELVRANPNDSQARRILASSHGLLSEALYREGEDSQAVAQAAASDVILAALFENSPHDADLLRERYRLTKMMGDANSRRSAPTEFRRDYERAVELRRQLDQLVDPSPRDRHDLSTLLGNLGDSYFEAKEYNRAGELYQQGFDIMRQLVEERPEDRAHQRSLAVTHFKMGDSDDAQGDATSAEEHTLEALKILQKLTQNAVWNPGEQRLLNVAYTKVGKLALSQKKLEKAESSLQESVSLLERLLEDEPKNMDYRRDLLVTLGALSNLYKAQNQFARSVETLQNVLQRRQKLLRQQPDNRLARRDVGVALGRLADAERLTKEFDSAAQHLNESQEIVDSLLSESPRDPSFLQDEYVLTTCRADLAHTQERYGQAAIFYLNACDQIDELAKLTQAPQRFAAHRQYCERILTAMSYNPRVVADLNAISETPEAQRSPTLTLRGLILAERKQHAEVVATAEKLVELDPQQPTTLYNAGCLLSRAYDVVASGLPNDQLNAEQRDLRERYAQRAIELLKQIQSAGYFDDPAHVTEFRKDPDWEPLRLRDDFKSFDQQLPQD